MTLHSPRSAAVLFARALSHLDLVEPEAAREPIRNMFQAGIELCAVSKTLLGQPTGFVLDLAQALVDTANIKSKKESTQ
jgi:hypothetical protein